MLNRRVCSRQAVIVKEIESRDTIAVYFYLVLISISRER